MKERKNPGQSRCPSPDEFLDTFGKALNDEIARLMKPPREAPKVGSLR